MNDKAVVQRGGGIENKISWNNLFINQTYLPGADLLPQGIPKE